MELLDPTPTTTNAAPTTATRVPVKRDPDTRLLKKVRTVRPALAGRTPSAR